MRVCDENLADFAKIIPGLDDAARYAVAGINQVERSVDNQ
jgi:hypothetical protein